MSVGLSELRAGHALTPRFFWYSFLLEADSTPGAIVRLEWLGKVEKKKNPMSSSGTESATYPVCNIASQRTTLPRAEKSDFSRFLPVVELTIRAKCWNEQIQLT
jgi:hypothetical protein